MIKRDHTEKPFQFGLQSLFVATLAIALALGLLNWRGTRAFFALMLFSAPFAVTLAILVTCKGGWTTAWGYFILTLCAFVVVIVISWGLAPTFR